MICEKNEYPTADLPFAAYLVTSKRLPYLRCVWSIDRMQFIFSDPKGEGNRIFMEYQSGAEAPILLFYSAVKFLRQEISSAQGRRVAR